MVQRGGRVGKAPFISCLPRFWECLNPSCNRQLSLCDPLNPGFEPRPLPVRPYSRSLLARQIKMPNRANVVRTKVRAANQRAQRRHRRRRRQRRQQEFTRCTFLQMLTALSNLPPPLWPHPNVRSLETNRLNEAPVLSVVIDAQEVRWKAANVSCRSLRLVPGQAAPGCRRHSG